MALLSTHTVKLNSSEEYTLEITRGEGGALIYTQIGKSNGKEFNRTSKFRLSKETKSFYGI